MVRVLAAAALMLALPCWGPAALAQSCGDEQTQSGMNECAGTAERRADAALNEAFRQVTARLQSDPGASAQLVAAQRAWLQFRDAECRFETELSEGGSIRPFLQARCLEGVTRARTAEFEAWLRCKEGDLSCPLPPR